MLGVLFSRTTDRVTPGLAACGGLLGSWLVGVLGADRADDLEVVGDDAGDTGCGELVGEREVVDGPGEDEVGVVAEGFDFAGGDQFVVEAAAGTGPISELVLQEVEGLGGAGGADDSGIGVVEEVFESVPVLGGDHVGSPGEVLGEECTERGGEAGVGAFEVEHGLDVLGEAAEDLGKGEWAVAAEGEGPAVPAEGDGAEGLVVADLELASVEPDVDLDDVGAGLGCFVDQLEFVAVAVGDEQGALVWWHGGLPLQAG